MSKKIRFKHFHFEAFNFASKEDHERFEKFASKLLTVDALHDEPYCTLSPIFNKDGKILSFILDSPEATKMLRSGGD